MTEVEDPITTPAAAADALEKVTVGDDQRLTDDSVETPPGAGSPVEQNITAPPASATPVNGNTTKSALQENIERKGKNAYYFAHAHKATGPQWDGKAEPKLLSRSVSSSDENGADSNNKINRMSSSFDYQKSNITAYAFSDEGKNVKLYITMEDIGEKCSDEDVSLEFTESSLSLVVHNYKDEEPQCLCFGRLTAKILGAKCRIKKDRIILTLTKEDQEKEWHTINDKGSQS